ncbi:MAG: hypothetical protein ABIG10_03725 [bacterium]
MNNNNKKLNINNFFKLPVKEREKLMSEVAGEANKDQRSLIKKYNQKFEHKHAEQTG